MQHRFFNLTIRNPMAPAYHNTLTFYQYLFIIRSIMRVSLVYWNSQHPKGHFTYFSGQTPHFLSDKQKPRSNNLHHQKSWSVPVQLIQKSVAIICSTRWQSNVHCILQGLLVAIKSKPLFVIQTFMKCCGCYILYWPPVQVFRYLKT